MSRHVLEAVGLIYIANRISGLVMHIFGLVIHISGLVMDILVLKKRVFGHNFGAKKGLGAIFYESSYAVTWGSLRIHSIRFEQRCVWGWPAVTRVMSRDCRAGWGV